MTNQNNNDGFGSGTSNERFQTQSPDQSTGSRDAGYTVETQRTVQVEQSEERSATDKVKDNPGKTAGIVGGVAAAAVGAVVAGKSAMNFGKDQEDKSTEVRTEYQVQPQTETNVEPLGASETVHTSGQSYSDPTADYSDSSTGSADRSGNLNSGSGSYDSQNRDR
jgi:hypothetical protein